MDQVTEKTVYELVTARKIDNTLMHALPLGRAISFPGTQYYVLKLWAFYNMTYYLVKNHCDDLRYTVYARKIDDDSGVKFQNPVGAGWISTEMTSHLEIKFRFPRQSIFMSLYPQSV